MEDELVRQQKEEIDKLLKFDPHTAEIDDINNKLEKIADLIVELDEIEYKDQIKKLRPFYYNIQQAKSLKVQKQKDGPTEEDLIDLEFHIVDDYSPDNESHEELTGSFAEAPTTGCIHDAILTSKDFFTLLEDLLKVLNQSGFAQSPGSLPLPGTIREIIHKLQEAHKKLFFISIGGEGKTGKSTFINALIGQDVMKTDLLPCTGNVCTLMFGKKLSAQVQNSRTKIWTKIILTPDKRLDEQLMPYTRMKQSNAEVNASEGDFLNVKVFLTAEILKNHICLRDLPGLNQDLSNTSFATEALKKSHAVIWVTDARKPFTYEERRVIKILRQKLNHDRIFVVANHYDEVKGSIIYNDPEYTDQEKQEDLVKAQNRFKEEVFKHVKEHFPAVYERRATMVHFTSSLHGLTNKKRKKEGRQCIPEPGTDFPFLEKCLNEEIIRQREVLTLGPICHQLANHISQLSKYIKLQLQIASHDTKQRKIRLYELEEKLKVAQIQYHELTSDGTVAQLVEKHVVEVLRSLDEWKTQTIPELQKMIEEWNPRDRTVLEREAKILGVNLTEHISIAIEQLRCLLIKRVDEERENLKSDLSRHLELVIECVTMISTEDLNTLPQWTFQPEKEVTEQSIVRYGAAGLGLGGALGAGAGFYFGAAALFPPATLAAVAGALLFSATAYYRTPSWERTVQVLRDKQLKLASSELKRVHKALSKKTKELITLHFNEISNAFLDSLQEAITFMLNQLKELKEDTRSKQQIEQTFRQFDKPLDEITERFRVIFDKIQQKTKM